MALLYCFSTSELTRSILSEHKKTNISVETNRLKEARRRLIDESSEFLILTGYSGDGLSTLGYDLLLDFPNREHFITRCYRVLSTQEKRMLFCLLMMFLGPRISMKRDLKNGEE